MLKRLESLDTNPRYKLLQFQKTQLDRLLPPAHNNGAGKDDGSPLIDTTVLSNLLMELSTLLHDRDDLLDTLQAKVKEIRHGNDISSLLERVDPSKYDSTLRKVRPPLSSLGCALEFCVIAVHMASEARGRSNYYFLWLCFSFSRNCFNTQ